jgi:hypothetical protein
MILTCNSAVASLMLSRFLWHFLDPWFGWHIVLWHFLNPQFSLLIFCGIIWTHSFADYFLGHFLDHGLLDLYFCHINWTHCTVWLIIFLGHFLSPWLGWLIFLSHYLNPQFDWLFFGPFSGPMFTLTYIFVALFGPTVWLNIFLGNFLHSQFGWYFLGAFFRSMVRLNKILLNIFRTHGLPDLHILVF